MPRLQLADGQRLAYHDIGSRAPNAPTLVLLHGFGMRAAFWIPLLAGLTKDTRVVLPDFRGFGNSHGTHYSQADVLSQSADDLQLLLDALQLKQVALAGLSMGACVSMRYFERHGHQRVSRYLNIDQAPCVSNQPDWQWGLFGTQQTRRYGEFRALLAAVEHSGAPSDYRALPWRLRRQANSAFSKFFGAAFFLPGHRWGMQAGLRIPGLAQQLLPRRNWLAYMHCMRAYVEQNYDFRAGLAQLDIPLTAMIGLRSQMYPAAGQMAFAKLAPRAELLPLRIAGHAIPFERPTAFRRALRRFLA